MIAVDAMGGDYAPLIAVKGAYNAAKKGIAVKLFGQQLIITELLDQFDRNWSALPISIVHCNEIIEMAEEPSRAVFKKKNSSLHRAILSVSAQECSAFVSAGHSGAVLVSSVLSFGKIHGISRPALGTYLPTKKGWVFCIDLGANTDCKPDYLRQFAYMGSTYVRLTKDIEKPRVGLLSNGSERYKGSLLVKEAYDLLEKSSLNFIGNIEAKEIFNDYVDVIVCDGFAGNVLLKSIQGTASAFKEWLMQEYQSNVFNKIIGLLTKPIFNRMKKKMDYTQYGGALLLGVEAPVVVAHGSSDEVAIENAIIFANKVVNDGLVSRFNYSLSETLMQENVMHHHDELRGLENNKSEQIVTQL